MANLIGKEPNQVSVNGMLGGMAFQSPEAVVLKPQSSATPVIMGDLVFQLTSNTTLVLKVLGTDGVIRSTSLALS